MTTSNVLPPLGAIPVGTELTPRTVRAHNASTASENKIHDDDVARTYGFKGGLVPGVTDYAYMASMLAAALGERWVTSGEATVTFVAPLYEGESATSRAVATAVEPFGGGERVTFDFWVENPAGQRCGTGTATAYTAGLPPFSVPAYRDVDPGPAPDPRPELVLDTAPVGASLARLVLPTSAADAFKYAESVFDENPLFRERSSWGPPLMHPGWLLHHCNGIFTRSFRFGPWIHTRSQIRYLGPALAGSTFTYHGRLAEVYERRLHHYAVLEICCEDEQGRPVTEVRHTAIFRLGAQPTNAHPAN